jgi:DUF1009 family protein
VETSEPLGLIAGSGTYPLLLARSARAAGVKQILAVAFINETRRELEAEVDRVEWMRVGQLGRLLKFFQEAGIKRAIMAGQIAPENLFDLRPDWKALLMLGRLQRRNAESIFGAIAQELQKIGVNLLDATTYMDKYLAPAGHIAGRKLRPREAADVEFGFGVAREISRLDIGQTVIVKNGTVLAVEGFEGTNETIRRGGSLGRKGAIMVKVAKANQDMRFDVPVIGPETIRVADEAQLGVIAIEAGKTLLLERESIADLADNAGIAILGRSCQ